MAWVKAHGAEETLPGNDFFCRMREGKEFSHSVGRRNYLLLCCTPADWATINFKEVSL